MSSLRESKKGFENLKKTKIKSITFDRKWLKSLNEKRGGESLLSTYINIANMIDQLQICTIES